MDRVRSVLAYQGCEIAAILVGRGGLAAVTADLFVSIAGADLIRALRRRAERSEVGVTLADPAEARRLLTEMNANGIATRLKLPPVVVWRTLRIFVPGVLHLADRARGPEDSPHPSDRSRGPVGARSPSEPDPIRIAV